MRTRSKVAGAIQWYEGMMLAPQHFQQNELRTFQSQSLRLQLLSPFAYGFSSLTIDTLALAKNIFVVSELEGILPDGEIFSIPQPLQVSIGDFATHNPSDVTIWLGIAPWSEAVSPLNRDNPRYKVIEEKAVGSFEDTSNVLPISRMVPIIQLYASKEKNEALVSMPIAKVQCEHNVFSLAPFVAPCFSMNDAKMILEEMREIAQLCRTKEIFLLKKLDRVLGTKKEFPTLMALDKLRAAIPMIELIVNNPEVHPFEAYKEMCRVVGELALFKKDVVAKHVVPYHHEHIYHSFLGLLAEVKKSVEGIFENYQYLAFDVTEDVFSIFINAETDKLLISLTFKTGAKEKTEWVDNAIIVSDSEVDLAVKERITGAKRRILKTHEYPEDLYEPGDLLIEIEVDNKYVFNNRQLIIFNPIQKENPEQIFWCVKE